jgi:hypothetical protein
MNDVFPKIAIGLVTGIACILLGFYLGELRQPDLQLVIERPIELATERIRVLRLRNHGGGVATGAEVRFSAKIMPANLALVTKVPKATIDAEPTVLTLDKLKPHDSVVLFYKEPTGNATPPRELIETALYDQGQVVVSTGDENRETEVQRRLNGAYFIGAVGMLLVLIAGASIQTLLDRKRPAVPPAVVDVAVPPAVVEEIEKIVDRMGKKREG